MRTKAAVVQDHMREPEMAAPGCSNTGRSDPSDGDALEELFAWGAKVATEQNLTVEKLDAILKAARDRLRE